jgi:ribosomal protein S18 acetylase RimI-like enzyme
VGAQLLAFVERRVFREAPNLFLFVSSFNEGARRFYEAHGYELVGEVTDFLVAGHGECLMRKSLGPLLAWRPDPEAGAQGPGGK